MGRQDLRRLGEHHGLLVLDILLDIVPQRVESGLKRRSLVGLLQGCHAFPELLMVLQRLTDQPLPRLVGLLGKDMLGNDLLQVRIGCSLILLEERAYLAVTRCEHRHSIVRLVSYLVIIGMGTLCHGKCSPYIEVKRPASHPEPPGAALLSSSMLSTDSKCYAMAMCLKRVW